MIDWNNSTFWAPIDKIHNICLFLPKNRKKYDCYIIPRLLVFNTIIMGFYLFGIVAFIFKGYSGEVTSNKIGLFAKIFSKFLDLFRWTAQGNCRFPRCFGFFTCLHDRQFQLLHNGQQI